MTINAHSMEYLDLCGVLESQRSKIQKDLKDNISTLEKYLDSEGNQTLGQIHREIQKKKMKIDEYDDDGNKLMEKIPSIIAPTENGWQSPPWHYYLLDKSLKGDFRIIVTAENARQICE
ncbi:MAG: hypothetical protein WB988_09275, partial [Candidatus Nitrosopolaris sp.]